LRLFIVSKSQGKYNINLINIEIMNREIDRLMIKNNIPRSICTLYGIDIQRVAKEYAEKQLDEFKGFAAKDSKGFFSIPDILIEKFKAEKLSIPPLLPDNINSEKEHLQYLKDISLIKELKHHKDTTIGLYAFDKDINKIFEEIPTEGKTITEQLMLDKISYLKSIVFQIK